MIERIIIDINKALDAEAYMAALSLVLTLPDICAKAEYGDTMHNRERYEKWYNEYLGQYEKAPTSPDEEEMPYLSGEVVYQLRCAVLHEGTPTIDKNKIREACCVIDHLVLVIEKKKPFNIYGDSSSVIQDNGKTVRSYQVNIRRLCMIITAVAGNYYKNHRERFNFLKYEILDWDKAVEELNAWNGVIAE